MKSPGEKGMLAWSTNIPPTLTSAAWLRAVPADPSQKISWKRLTRGLLRSSKSRRPTIGQDASTGAQEALGRGDGRRRNPPCLPGPVVVHRLVAAPLLGLVQQAVGALHERPQVSVALRPDGD